MLLVLLRLLGMSPFRLEPKTWTERQNSVSEVKLVASLKVRKMSDKWRLFKFLPLSAPQAAARKINISTAGCPW